VDPVPDPHYQQIISIRIVEIKLQEPMHCLLIMSQIYQESKLLSKGY
jgi:hypothetical protein